MHNTIKSAQAQTGPLAIFLIALNENSYQTISETRGHNQHKSQDHPKARSSVLKTCLKFKVKTKTDRLTVCYFLKPLSDENYLHIKCTPLIFNLSLFIITYQAYFLHYQIQGAKNTCSKIWGLIYPINFMHNMKRVLYSQKLCIYLSLFL